MDKNTRKREIEILRLLFTIAVCLHHLRYCTDSLPYGGGYIAVDFFFIVSGFYLRKSFCVNFENGKEISTYSYVKKRYIRLFKDYIIAWILATIMNIAMFGMEIKDKLLLYVKEATMIEIGCISSSLRMNPPDWYCGYLLISSVLVFFLLKVIKQRVIYISAISSVVLFTILAGVYGHINIFPKQEGILSPALIRAVAGQLLGVFLYEIYLTRNKTRHEGSDRKVKLCVGVLVGYVCFMLFWDTAYGLSDYLVVVAIAVLFYICTIIKFDCLEKVDASIWRWISELSYVMFLNHYIVVKLFAYYDAFKYVDWKIVSLVYLIVVVVVSGGLLVLRKQIDKLLISPKA